VAYQVVYQNEIKVSPYNIAIAKAGAIKNVASLISLTNIDKLARYIFASKHISINDCKNILITC